MVADALSRPPAAQGTTIGTQQKPAPTTFTAVTELAGGELGCPDHGDAHSQQQESGSSCRAVLAPEPQVLASIADAQPVYFSAMTTQQQSCPKVAEMLTSGNLQITSQTIGSASLLGGLEVPPY